MNLSTRYSLAVSVDCLVFGYEKAQLRILLIRRSKAPFAGSWALPGGFVENGETLKAAAERELAEETGIKRVYLEQFGVFDGPGRDPRGRVLSTGFLALVKPTVYDLVASSDAVAAAWFLLDELPPLAFDHADILAAGLKRLRSDILRRPIGLELLNLRFTIGQLQSLYETILHREFDTSNFRKKILSLGLLLATDEYETDVAHRAARLYSFDRRVYQQLLAEGFKPF
jgi:8-oxo-dGTP diphosphatase